MLRANKMNPNGCVWAKNAFSQNVKRGPLTPNIAGFNFFDWGVI
jgi:hypothetical protein